MSENEEVSTKETKEQFIGRDLLESYIYYCNFMPCDPIERYNILVKTITFGMELLPYYFDFDETDLKKMELNEKNQERIDKIYKNAQIVLQEEIPSKRKIEYDYIDIGGKRFMIYTIQSSENKDAKTCHAREEELSKVLDNFIIQQHEQHIPKLQNAHNQILHELTQSGIVPSNNPTYSEIKEEWKKQRIKERLNGTEV